MSAFWLFLHILGITLWMGGGMANMQLGLRSQGESPAGLRTIARLQTMIMQRMIAVGSILVVLSGLMLTIRLMGALDTGLGTWLMVMQGTGILGALINLIFGLPLANRIGRLDPEGPDSALFSALRARQRKLLSLAGLLAFVALLGGVLNRMGY